MERKPNNKNRITKTGRFSQETIEKLGNSKEVNEYDKRNHTVRRNSKKTTQKNEKYRKNQKKKQLSMEGQQIGVYGRKNPCSKQLEDLRANPVGKS